MIIVRAPLRISFVGGGTDLKNFYSRYPGRVISTSINKYVYIVVNQHNLLNEFIIKYQITEIAKHPKEFQNNRFREALLKLGLVRKGLEIASFADLPSKTGLGSSSSFSVALLKALHIYLGKPISKEQAAKAACELEIDILKEPIGKQDQYASAFGGLNMFQFNPNGTVDVEPIFLDFKARAKIESHLLLHFTGITRDAASVLGAQNKRVADNFKTYKQMSDSVLEFKDKMVKGDVKGMAKMLHQGWLRKKTLSSGISNNAIDELYETGLKVGAWGGKVLGAGGGGCLLFLAPPEKHAGISKALHAKAAKLKLAGDINIPFKLSQSGADVLLNSQA